MAIRKSKYYYGDMSLREYCEKNSLNYNTIISRVYNLKKENPDKMSDEIIEMAINFENSNHKYYYNNMLLAEYCKQNNLNYTTVKARIFKLIEENPKKELEEIIELAINFENSNHKYFYNNMLLVEYCKQNNLNYTTIKGRIYKLTEENPDKELEEIIEMAINFESNNHHYYYENMLLLEYCKKNNLNYNTIMGRIYKLMKQNPDKKSDEIIEIAINFENNNHQYYYDNMLLTDYCKKSNLNYNTIRGRIYKLMEQNPDKGLEEIIELAVNFEINNRQRYFYENMSLVEYCEKNNLQYKTIIDRIYKLKNKCPEKEIEEIIEMAVNFESSTHKYYYNNMTLHQYCKINSLKYGVIRSQIFKATARGEKPNLDVIIQEGYERFKQQRIRDILKMETYSSLSELEENCKFLNISYKNIIELQNLNFSIKTAINIVYFFGELNSDNVKHVSNDKINYIVDFITTINEFKDDTEMVSDNLLILYKLYKCNLYDSRFLFVKNFKPYINKLIYSIFDIYGIRKSNDNVKELHGELDLKILELLDRCVTLNKFQLIKYITLSLKYYCINYCFKNFSRKGVSLDYEDFEHRKMYNFIDANSDGLFFDEEIDMSVDGYFSESLKNAIKDLDKNSLIFIKLKYIEQYDNSLIAEYLNLTVDEVNKIEENVLNYLRSKPEVVSLIYKK